MMAQEEKVKLQKWTLPSVPHLNTDWPFITLAGLRQRDCNRFCFLVNFEQVKDSNIVS